MDGKKPYVKLTIGHDLVEKCIEHYIKSGNVDQDRKVSIDGTTQKIAKQFYDVLSRKTNPDRVDVFVEPSGMDSKIESDPDPDSDPRIRTMVREADKMLRRFVQETHEWIVYEDEMPVEFTDQNRAWFSFLQWDIARKHPEFDVQTHTVYEIEMETMVDTLNVEIESLIAEVLRDAGISQSAATIEVD